MSPLTLVSKVINSCLHVNILIFKSILLFCSTEKQLLDMCVESVLHASLDGIRTFRNADQLIVSLAKPDRDNLVTKGLVDFISSWDVNFTRCYQTLGPSLGVPFLEHLC